MKITKRVTYFEHNNQEYQLVIDDRYTWICGQERKMFHWIKYNDEWFVVEYYKSKASNANWFRNKEKECECPEIEIEYQRYLREQKLGRICND
jgi:hypothetical protein